MKLTMMRTSYRMEIQKEQQQGIVITVRHWHKLHFLLDLILMIVLIVEKDSVHLKVVVAQSKIIAVDLVTILVHKIIQLQRTKKCRKIKKMCHRKERGK